MRKLLPLIAALSLACSVGLAQAAERQLTPQQQKMKTCNQEATGKKGDERKAFMKECLKKAPAAKAPESAAASKRAAQNEKMKTCNKEAVGKKGAERKAFMKECLSK
jgi:hypothetical protein